MLKNPEDRRAKRTRKLLKESLLTLMAKKRFPDISIRDVTDLADVNRTTFYLHYSDTAQLLQSIEADLLEEAQALISAHIQETVADGTMRPVFEPILDFVVERREVCTTLLANNESSHFMDSLQQLIQKNGDAIIRAWYHPENEQAIPYLLSFIAYGLIGLMVEWFQNGAGASKEEVLSTAELLVDGAAARLLSH